LKIQWLAFLANAVANLCKSEGLTWS